MAQESPDHVLRNLAQNLNNTLEEAKNPNFAPSSDGDPELFYQGLRSAAARLSHEADKVALAWRNPPPPSTSDAVEIANALENASVTFLAAFLALGADAGENVTAEVSAACRALLEDCLSLVTALADEAGSDGKHERASSLQVGGILWTSSKRIADGEVSRDNAAACSKAIDREQLLVKDAFDELQECLGASDPEGDLSELGQSWSKEEMELVPPGIGLVKVARYLLKKTSSALQQFGRVQHKSDRLEMDLAVSVCREVCPLVDDFALSLYSPIDIEKLKESSEKLKDALESILATLKGIHFVPEESFKQWGVILEQATAHNFKTLCEKMNAHT